MLQRLKRKWTSPTGTPLIHSGFAMLRICFAQKVRRSLLLPEATLNYPEMHELRWSRSARGTYFLRKALLMVGLLLASCSEPPKASLPPDSPSRTVEVQIDFNGRRPNKQLHVSWKPDLNVYSSLEELQATGELSVARRGTGDQTLVTALDGLENLWAAGDNWIYYVNDRMGDRSSAVYALQPGDVVVWRFGKYAPK